LSSYGIGYGVVAVALALLDFGVWSLVAGSLVQGVVACAVALALARHPVRPLLDRAEVRDLFDFGLGVILNRLVTYAAYNGDNLVVGRWLGTAALGLYGRAFQLVMFPLSHVGAVT